MSNTATSSLGSQCTPSQTSLTRSLIMRLLGFPRGILQPDSCHPKDFLHATRLEILNADNSELPRAPNPTARDSDVSATASIKTQLPPYKPYASPMRSMFPPPPSYESARLRDIDQLFASSQSVDFEPQDAQALHNCLSIIKASIATSPAPVTSGSGSAYKYARAVAGVLGGHRRPSDDHASISAGDAEFMAAREELAKIVHRRLAMLRLEGTGGSVHALEYWYRDVVKILGWRDRDESEI